MGVSVLSSTIYYGDEIRIVLVDTARLYHIKANSYAHANIATEIPYHQTTKYNLKNNFCWQVTKMYDYSRECPTL